MLSGAAPTGGKRNVDRADHEPCKHPDPVSFSDQHDAGGGGHAAEVQPADLRTDQHTSLLDKLVSAARQATTRPQPQPAPESEYSIADARHNGTGVRPAGLRAAAQKAMLLLAVTAGSAMMGAVAVWATSALTRHMIADGSDLERKQSLAFVMALIYAAGFFLAVSFYLCPRKLRARRPRVVVIAGVLAYGLVQGGVFVMDDWNPSEFGIRQRGPIQTIYAAPNTIEIDDEQFWLASNELRSDGIERAPELLRTELTDVESRTPAEMLLDNVGLDETPGKPRARVNWDGFSEEIAPKPDIAMDVKGQTQSGPFAGRNASHRSRLLAKYGGDSRSEAAVENALQWFERHQLPDGGWSFDHQLAVPCGGKCTHAGTAAEARNAATGLALLPYLGAGQTHQEGKYKEQVFGGLYFLVSRMMPQGNGGSWHEGGGSMYSHGIAAIAVCEAYAMTKDRELLVPAQACLNFIVSAQDPIGGGWRYSPKQAGDTSVSGWQIMAIKSGYMAYLQTGLITVQRAVQFLDTVSSDSGAFYGYTAPGKGDATTAIGLLCQMYLGWDQENPALARGAEYLSNIGPTISGNRAAMYYNYYATRVMHQYYGEDNAPEWNRWNTALRDGLVDAQNKAKGNHDFGSWFFLGDHGSDRGGRVYCTAMATLILEVYYRHAPIYQKREVREDFAL